MEWTEISDAVLTVFISGPVAQIALQCPGIQSRSHEWSHTFVEIDHEIISTVILLHPLIQKWCCQLQAKVCVQSLVKLAQEKVWLGELTVWT